MGSGTAVAKSASKMILTESNFTSIVTAAEEGRPVGGAHLHIHVAHHTRGGRTNSWMISFVVKTILNYIIAFKITSIFFNILHSRLKSYLKYPYR